MNLSLRMSLSIEDTSHPDTQIESPTFVPITSELNSSFSASHLESAMGQEKKSFSKTFLDIAWFTAAKAFHEDVNHIQIGN
jgi:hypothetical protein